MSSEERQLSGYQKDIQTNQALIKTAEKNLADAKASGNAAKIASATSLLNAAKYNIGVYTAKAQPLIQIVAQQKYAAAQAEAAKQAAAAAAAKAAADKEAATIEGRKKAEVERAMQTSAYFDPGTQTASPYFNPQSIQNPDPESYKSQSEKVAADLSGVKELESLSLQAYEQSGTPARLEAARAGEGGSIFETGAGFQQVGLDGGQQFVREEQPISPFGDEGAVVGGTVYEQDVAKELDVKKQTPKFVDITLSEDYVKAAEIQKNVYVPEANFTSGSAKIVPADEFGIPGLSGNLVVDVPPYSTLGEEKFAILGAELKAKGSVPTIKSAPQQSPVDSIFGMPVNQTQSKQPSPVDAIFSVPTGVYKSGETNVPSSGNLIDQLFGQQPQQKQPSKSLPPVPAAGFIAGADIFGDVYKSGSKAVGDFSSFLQDIGSQFGVAVDYGFKAETKAEKQSRQAKEKAAKLEEEKMLKESGIFRDVKSTGVVQYGTFVKDLGFEVKTGKKDVGYGATSGFIFGETTQQVSSKKAKAEELARKAAEEKARRAAEAKAEKAARDAFEKANKKPKTKDTAFPGIDKQFQNIFSPTPSTPSGASKTPTLKKGKKSFDYLYYGQY